MRYVTLRGRMAGASFCPLIVNRKVVLSVQDNGAGIAPDALPHIFERFYRGDALRQQSESESGLGLAIAKSLVEAHGGTITATSEGVGKGSTFSVCLPE